MHPTSATAMTRTLSRKQLADELRDIGFLPVQIDIHTLIAIVARFEYGQGYVRHPESLPELALHLEGVALDAQALTAARDLQSRQDAGSPDVAVAIDGVSGSQDSVQVCFTDGCVVRADVAADGLSWSWQCERADGQWCPPPPVHHTWIGHDTFTTALRDIAADLASTARGER